MMTHKPMLEGCRLWTLENGDCGHCEACSVKAARAGAKEAIERFEDVLNSLSHKLDDVTVYIGPFKTISIGDLRAIAVWNTRTITSTAEGLADE